MSAIVQAAVALLKAWDEGSYGDPTDFDTSRAEVLFEELRSALAGGPPVPPPDLPAVGQQVILCGPHNWQGHTGVVSAGPPSLPDRIIVSLHDLETRVEVRHPAEVRVLATKERRDGWGRQ